MIRIHDFGVNVEAYFQLGKDNDFPVIPSCPHCRLKKTLHRHGFYARNAIVGGKVYRIYICRYRCSDCRRTMSVLPSFLLPFFQYTVHEITNQIHEALARRIEGKKACVQHKNTELPTRQGIAYYLRRYQQCIPWIQSYFASRHEWIHPCLDAGFQWIKKIKQRGVEMFIQQSWGHLSAYFLANCFRA